jgi:co-chaperonin GroES (HSP10)
MKATHGSILIKATGVYNHFVKHGSLTLYVDPLFKPGQRRVIHGIVESIPDGVPEYMDLVPEVQVSDKLYFHYNALDPDNLIPDSDGVFSILYDMVLCSVRDGKIIPLAGKIFCSKVYDDDVVDLKIEGEIKKCRVSGAGIITEINCKYSEKIARLEHIGTPRPGRKIPTVKVGDKVVYIKDGDFINHIEGQEYFVMNQEDILATV